MAAITPVPTTRVSDTFIRQRLQTQLQYDQRELFRVQAQLSTGRRIFAPSEDAPAALRAMSLQRLIERKEQVQTNLTTNQSFLSATDTAMGSVSGLLQSVRATAVSVTGITASDTQRTAAAQEVSRALQQMFDIGNQKFRGRYLFSGSQTNAIPFELLDGFVKFTGDERDVYSYSDIDVLFETNLGGNEAFGTLSEPVRGSVDLNPVLQETTRLSDLHGGRGIRVGSVKISDGTNSSTVDISSASTIGDVARLLETNPPAGRVVTAIVTATGLDVSIDAAGGGSLTISEVGGGTTASELGIRDVMGGGVGPIIGGDLNPMLRPTTPLANILGSRATANLGSAGAFNDLVLEASRNGLELNGVRVSIVDHDALQAGPGLVPGNEIVNYSDVATPAVASLRLTGAANDLILTATAPGAAFNGVAIDIVNGGNIGDAATASYNPATKRLTLTIDDTNETSTDALIAAIDLDGTFTAARDASAEANAAGGVIPTVAFGADRGNTRNTGGDPKTLFVYVANGQSTANQVMAAVNAEGTFSARLDLSEQNNDGIGYIQDSWTDPLASVVTSGGSGIVFDQTSGLRVTSGGQTHDISFAGATTVEDLMNILNGADAGLLAELNPEGTGINVRSRLSGADFAIGENGGTTATELGLRSFTRETPLADLNHGRGVNSVEGNDFTIHRKDGVSFSIDVDGLVSIEDVMQAINTNPVNIGSGTPVTARLTTSGNGIELVNNGPTGSLPLRIERANSSEAAWDLGLIPAGTDNQNATTPGLPAAGTLLSAGANNDIQFTATAVGDRLNGLAISFVDSGLGAGNETVSYDATAGTLVFDIDTASTTANQVLGLLAGDPVASTLVTGALVATDGTPNDGSGLMSLAATTALAGGEAATVLGTDVNPVEVKGVFSALIRLQSALLSNDLREIERSVALLDEGLLTVNFARSELGVRQHGLDVLQTRLESEDVELRANLSLEIDVDLATAISEMTARQASLEAALRTTAKISQLTLLNFL